MKNIPLALRQAKNAFGQDSPWLPLLELTLPSPDNTVFRIVPNNEDIVFPGKVNSGNNASFARTGTAVNPYTGASVATGVPRYNAASGILIEEASTNILLYSEQFDNAYWSKYFATVTTDATNNPFGATTAEKIIPNSTGTSQGVYKEPITGITSGLPYTFTVYAKAGEYGALRLIGNNGASAYAATFNLSSGIFHSKGTSVIDASIMPISDGWYRCSITVNSISTSTGIRIYVGPVSALSSSGVLNSFTADGTSGLYVFGSQLEQKSSATSNAPTTTTSVTRNVESLSFLTTGVLNATEGTISFKANPTKSGRIFQSTVDGNNYFLIADNNVYVVVAGVVVANLTGVSSLNSENRFTFTWGSGGKKFYKNEVVTGSSANTTNLPIASTIAPNGSFPFNGTVGDVIFYNRCLTDAEVTAIGTGNKPKDFSAYYPLTSALTKFVPGNTYSAFPVKIELPNETSKGEIPSITLQVSNVTRVLQGHLEALNGGVGATVKLVIINTANLDEDYAELTMSFEVLSATCNNLWVSLKCGASNPLRRRFPIDKFFANHCNHQFNSPAVRASGSNLGAECAYAGSDTTCDRNLDACIAKGNAARFGGFPGLEPGGLQLV